MHPGPANSAHVSLEFAATGRVIEIRSETGCEGRSRPNVFISGETGNACRWRTHSKSDSGDRNQIQITNSNLKTYCETLYSGLLAPDSQCSGTDSFLRSHHDCSPKHRRPRHRETGSVFLFVVLFVLILDCSGTKIKTKIKTRRKTRRKTY